MKRTLKEIRREIDRATLFHDYTKVGMLKAEEKDYLKAHPNEKMDWFNDMLKSIKSQ
jgi:hypothetical protein